MFFKHLKIVTIMVSSHRFTPQSLFSSLHTCAWSKFDFIYNCKMTTNLIISILSGTLIKLFEKVYQIVNFFKLNRKHNMTFWMKLQQHKWFVINCTIPYVFWCSSLVKFYCFIDLLCVYSCQIYYISLLYSFCVITPLLSNIFPFSNYISLNFLR